MSLTDEKMRFGLSDIWSAAVKYTSAMDQQWSDHMWHVDGELSDDTSPSSLIPIKFKVGRGSAWLVSLQYDIFDLPPPEVHLAPDVCLRLQSALYGLAAMGQTTTQRMTTGQLARNLCKVVPSVSQQIGLMSMIPISKAMAISSSLRDIATPSTTSTVSGTSMRSTDRSSSADCNSSMFLNWYTRDVCFLSSVWHVTSYVQFAVSCVCVVGLVLGFEWLRRVQRTYDRHIIHRFNATAGTTSEAVGFGSGTGDDNSKADDDDSPHSAVPLLGDWAANQTTTPPRRGGHVPHPFQQAVRAALYTLQLAVAYLIMLLAMSFNGYFLICIVVGAFVGSLVFS
ncbi:MAG: Copper Transporter integral membrane protein that functions in high affinity copper transport [Sclerophora amabilis]|nr:MAG: Copper Transporter integral membrane protein that functions in high affinity copper transport [Sclerophora amabilis]